MNSILIIRFSSLGDVLLTSPLIRILRNTYPGARIDFVIKPHFSSAVENSPHLNSIYHFTAETAPSLKKQLKQHGYDMVVDLQNNIRSRRLSSGLAPVMHRFRKYGINKWLLVAFKIRTSGWAAPIPERYIASVPGLSPDGLGLEFHFTPADTGLPKESRYIAVAPGSKHFTKMWGSGRYAELCRLILASGITPVLVGGADDADICKEIQERCPGVVNLSGRNDTVPIASVMKQSLAVVCNDSGLMHLSCAVGVPVLVFFGSTVKDFGFFPYKNKSVVMENTTLTCRPCSHIGKSTCPKGHFLCMASLQPGEAFLRLKTLAGV